MASEQLFRTASLGITNDSAKEYRALRVNPTTNALQVEQSLSGSAVAPKDATFYGDGVTTGVAATTNELYNPVSAGYDRQRTVTTFKTVNAVTITTETTVWTPTAGKKFRIMGGIVSASAAGNILLRDNTAGAIIAIIPVAANTPLQITLGNNGILAALVNNVLTATLSVAGSLSGTLYGTEE